MSLLRLNELLIGQLGYITRPALVLGATALLVGCNPARQKAEYSLDSIEVPIGFKLERGQRYCQYGWISFTTQFEYERDVSREKAIDQIKECAAPFVETQFLLQATTRPALAGAEAARQISACVADKAGTYLKILDTGVQLRSKDWAKC